MGGPLKKHRHLLILAVLFALTLSLLFSNLREKSTLNLLERAALTVMAPFQGAVSWTVTNAFTVWDRYIHLVGVEEKNRRLRQTVDKLALENALLTERFKHYERLETMLSFPQLSSVSFEAARIIGRDTTGRVRMIILNKGTENGAAENMPVITHRGLVGRVVRAAGSAAKVLLITDVRSAVDAIVQETRDSLVVVGANATTLEVRYLAVGADVKEGDRVISSGLGGVYPKGLPIGTLTDIRAVGDSLFLSARLIPGVDLDRIEEALLIKGPIPGSIAEKDWP